MVIFVENLQLCFLRKVVLLYCLYNDFVILNCVLNGKFNYFEYFHPAEDF